MANKRSSLFECTVLPAMVILPVVAMFMFQRRIVTPPEVAAGRPAEEDMSHFNGFPYLQLAGETYRSGQAVERFTKLVAQREAELGRLDPETLIQRNNLANALLADKRYVEAEALQRELLKDMEASMAREHPDTFRCRFNLALNLRMQGKLPDARSEMEKVYEGWKDVLGEGHPRTQSALLVLEQLRSPL